METDFGHQGQTLHAISPLVDPHFNSQQANDSYHSSGGHYNFTTLTALDSYHFPSTSSLALHLGRHVRSGAGFHPIIGSRSLALSTTTKSGGKFVIVNLYQFTAANPAKRDEVLDIIKAWILKYPDDRIIIIGDFNCAPAGGRTGYSLQLNDNVRKADDFLHDFCQGTGGALASSRHHSWSQGKQSTALDNAITWNYHLSHPKVCS